MKKETQTDLFRSFFTLPIVLLSLSILLFIQCKPTPKSEHKEETKSSKLELPQIPTILTDPAQRAEYLVLHYWDNFNFSDTTRIGDKSPTEQEFSNFVDLFGEVSLTVVGQSVPALLDRALDGAPPMFEYFRNLYEKYLYDPNSPFRNEDYYIAVLQYIVASDRIDEDHKIRPRFQLSMALRNRIGQPAADIPFVLKDGRKMRIHAISSDFIVLFFNNPDCHDCARVKEMLTRITNPRVTIVAIYPDEDVKAWDKSTYPDRWISGRNTTIRADQSYDLRAIPSLYLLDKQKKVVLKDAPVEQILQYLNSHSIY